MSDHVRTYGSESAERSGAAPVGKQPQESDWFEDITSLTGIQHVYQTGAAAEQYSILETVGGGLALIDIDLDRQLDLFCAGGGTITEDGRHTRGSACGLFRQSHLTTFANISHLVTGLSVPCYSHGCTVGDMNNDGFPDILVTCFDRSLLFLNLGDGTFHNSLSDLSGSLGEVWNTAAATGDFNADGHPDFFLVGYVQCPLGAEDTCLTGPNSTRDICPPQRYDAAPDRLFFSSGDGHYADVSQTAGIRRDGKGLGVVVADVDGDNHLDIYVANDVVANHFYSRWDGNSFTESAELSGLAYNEDGSPEGSMGVDLADTNGDGRPEIFVTNFEMEDNSLYRVAGTRSGFQHATVASGLAGAGRTYVGFGTGLHDFNSDGWPDLYVLNGHVLYHSNLQPFHQPSLLFRSNNGIFEDCSDQGGPWFSVPHAARGGAVGDIDNDGSPDLVVSLLDEPFVVLRNRQQPTNWIRLQIVGTATARHAVGTRVSIECFERKCSQYVKSGAGYLSHSDQKLLFALPQKLSTVDVSVDWLTGHREFFRNLKAEADHVLIEGRGEQNPSEE